MTTTKRQYDKAFELEVIRLCETSGKSPGQIEPDRECQDSCVNSLPLDRKPACKGNVKIRV
ncbi:MAG: hypothetical protein DCC55_41140 [Chloroflexi bacterium]|nr:MAG: hypothetical protein DCC55_41140 [Chloroflexota bacterium]